MLKLVGWSCVWFAVVWFAVESDEWSVVQPVVCWIQGDRDCPLVGVALLPGAWVVRVAEHNPGRADWASSSIRKEEQVGKVRHGLSTHGRTCGSGWCMSRDAPCLDGRGVYKQHLHHQQCPLASPSSPRQSHRLAVTLATTSACMTMTSHLGQSSRASEVDEVVHRD